MSIKNLPEIDIQERVELIEQTKTFIVAVSGGVDSIVLLHKLVTSMEGIPDHRAPVYIVAHFDHGIREDSGENAEFVRTLAQHYSLPFELGSAELGADASEEQARTARYAFLREMKSKHGAHMIITAHHQDDLLETMIINLLRGTSPRGLSPMNAPDILRPLIHSIKDELVDYAQSHELQWREDPTNDDETYLRNHIRKQILPKLDMHREQLLTIQKRVADIYHDVDIRTSHLLPKFNVMTRSHFVQFPYIVQREIMRAWLIRHNVSVDTKEIVERCVMAVKTLPHGKKIDIDGENWLSSEKNSVVIVAK